MAKSLSYAGRLQLIRAVLFGVQAYWSQLFLMPKKVIKLIEATCRSYLWTGESTITKKAMVAWEKICLPKGAGGLNIPNLQLWNRAAICKLLWDLSMHKEKLWITWVHTYYIKRQDITTMDIPQQSSWMTRKILTMRKYWITLGYINKIVHNNKFYIAKAYKMLRGEVVNVAWSKMISKNIAEPKHVFILWLNFHGRLRTKDILISWNMNVDPMCV
ncbi:uncharacterized protein LOC129893059 [Solanum dulcamara]|uniref:uncharacterized protein LOC129893059 n=1 Tax=Solanum dulcamara TaxID=45834 RepID=UPI00248670C6|nr:uncharacterized protein LOC129893059 [Solanum dulcamara]